MKLYINCCVREELRTNRLAQAVLRKLGGEIAEIDLYKQKLYPLDKIIKSNNKAVVTQQGQNSRSHPA